jgi:hypothetical protein
VRLPDLHRDIRRTLFLLVFAVALGSYVVTASPFLRGYDPEAAESAKGYFETGQFQISDSPFLGYVGNPGADGKRISRVGLPQAALMVPFYAAGRVIESALPDAPKGLSYRQRAVALYEPVVAALAAALVALIVLRMTRSVAWAAVISLLFTFASIAWPYSKIGMDTTAMLGMTILIAGALSARPGSRRGWAVAGFGAGVAVAAKPYELFPVLVIGAFLWPTFKAVPPERRARVLSALCVPIAVWAALVCWYNLSRTGSMLNFGAQASFEPTLAAPINFVGNFLSPGKGLFWYSPLVILGVLGLRDVARVNRSLALALLGAVVAGSAYVALNPYWTDETWGPRYLVPVAWILLLPIPFWAVTRRRRAVLAGVATVAVAVQLVGVIAPYESTVRVYPALLDADFLAKRHGAQAYPYGHDPVRWIPQLSPIAVQGTLVSGWASSALGLGRVTYHWDPYEGRPHGLEVTERIANLLGIPDLWWRAGYSASLGWIVLIPLLVVAGAGYGLTTLVSRTRRVEPARTPG